jgi:hypothetical protein
MNDSCIYFLRKSLEQAVVPAYSYVQSCISLISDPFSLIDVERWILLTASFFGDFFLKNFYHLA